MVIKILHAVLLFVGLLLLHFQKRRILQPILKLYNQHFVAGCGLALDWRLALELEWQCKTSPLEWELAC